MSKAAVLALSETLAAELSGTGVSVSVLCPTFVKTNVIPQWDARLIWQLKRHAPIPYTRGLGLLNRLTGLTPHI